MASESARFMVPKVSPGKLYKGIALSRGDFEKGETKLVKPKQHGFVKLCKKIFASFPTAGGNEKFSQKMLIYTSKLRFFAKIFRLTLAQI